MTRILIAIDPDAEVQPIELAAAWNSDTEAQAVGTACAEETSGSDFFLGGVEVVVVSVLVNVGSSAIYDLLKRLVFGLRSDHHGESSGLEITEVTTRDGDRVVVVRTGSTP
jgi:hypothetical protein